MPPERKRAERHVGDHPPRDRVGQQLVERSAAAVRVASTGSRRAAPRDLAHDQ